MPTMVATSVASLALALTLTIAGAVPTTHTLEGKPFHRTWSTPRATQGWTEHEVDTMFTQDVHPRLQELSIKQVRGGQARLLRGG